MRVRRVGHASDTPDLKAFDLSCRPQKLLTPDSGKSRRLPLFNVDQGLSSGTRSKRCFRSGCVHVPDGFGVEAILVDPKLLDQVIRDIVSGIGSELADLSEDSGLEDMATKTAAPAHVDTAEVDTPVVRFVNKILMDAIRQKASDIHIEPYEEKLRIRYRLDGVLHEDCESPLSLSPPG